MRKVLEAVALAALLAMFAMLVMYSDLLPEQVPVHWNAAGAPDKWGSKDTLWIFPMIGAGIYVVLSVVGLLRRSKNPDAQQELVGHMICAVKVVTMITFAVMSRDKLESALGNKSGFGGMLAVVMIVLMGVGLIYARGAQNSQES